jgi:hypothetical protein
VIKNIRALFEHSPNAVLVEHQWLCHDMFLELIATMDLSMQVSYTETFNIVTADAVVQNIPVLVSNEIFWIPDMFYADPNSVQSIKEGIDRALFWRGSVFTNMNKKGLKKYNKKAKEAIFEAIDYEG